MAHRIEITSEFDIGDLVSFDSGRARGLVGRVIRIDVHEWYDDQKPYLVYHVHREGMRQTYYPLDETMRLIEPAKRQRRATGRDAR